MPCTPGEERDLCPDGSSYPQCFVFEDGSLEVEPCGFTPLAIDLAGDGIAFDPSRGHAFDIAATGACFDVDWPSLDDPWLVLDVDGDGAITDGRELFGSGTSLPDGKLAKNGFAALAMLDADGDGAITTSDPAFPRLALWSDVDGDRRGTAHELSPLAAYGIVALPLHYRHEPVCDARGNCLVERARAQTMDQSLEVVDVHLACQ